MSSWRHVNLGYSLVCFISRLENSSYIVKLYAEARSDTAMRLYVYFSLRFVWVHVTGL